MQERIYFPGDDPRQPSPLFNLLCNLFGRTFNKKVYEKIARLLNVSNSTTRTPNVIQIIDLTNEENKTLLTVITEMRSFALSVSNKRITYTEIATVINDIVLNIDISPEIPLELYDISQKILADNQSLTPLITQIKDIGDKITGLEKERSNLGNQDQRNSDADKLLETINSQLKLLNKQQFQLKEKIFELIKKSLTTMGYITAEEFLNKYQPSPSSIPAYSDAVLQEDKNSVAIFNLLFETELKYLYINSEEASQLNELVLKLNNVRRNISNNRAHISFN